MPRTTFVAQSPLLILVAVVVTFVASENVKSESYRWPSSFVDRRPNNGVPMGRASTNRRVIRISPLSCRSDAPAVVPTLSR